MKLSKEMKKIYGDPQFLPQSKKSQHGFPSEGSEVLMEKPRLLRIGNSLFDFGEALDAGTFSA